MKIDKITKIQVDNLLKFGHYAYIVSSHGDWSSYTGKASFRALKLKLTKTRKENEDEGAKAVVFSHRTAFAGTPSYMDIETGKCGPAF